MKWFVENSFHFRILSLRKWFGSKKSQYIFSFLLSENEKELVIAPITWWNYFNDAASVFWLEHYKWRKTAELGETWKSVTNGCRKSWYNFVFALYFPYKAKEYLRRGTHQEFPSNILGYECYISFWCLPLSATGSFFKVLLSRVTVLPQIKSLNHIPIKKISSQYRYTV